MCKFGLKDIYTGAYALIVKKNFLSYAFNRTAKMSYCYID